MLSSRRRAQTALETLFILGIILTGIFLIVPPYLDSSEETSIVVQVRNAASDACAYLNTGVKVEDWLHEPLNEILEASIYSSSNFVLEGISTTQSGNIITVNVIIKSQKSLKFWESGDQQWDSIEGGFREYIIRYVLKAKPAASRSGDVILFGRKRVVVNVEVSGEGS